MSVYMLFCDQFSVWMIFVLLIFVLLIFFVDICVLLMFVFWYLFCWCLFLIFVLLMFVFWYLFCWCLLIFVFFSEFLCEAVWLSVDPYMRCVCAHMYVCKVCCMYVCYVIEGEIRQSSVLVLWNVCVHM